MEAFNSKSSPVANPQQARMSSSTSSKGDHSPSPVVPSDEKTPQEVGNKSKEDRETKDEGFRAYLRIFKYTDKYGWAMFITAWICFAASGAALPLMDLIFGKFVTVFTRFATGGMTPAAFRHELTYWTLWFVYLFIAKFVLLYIAYMAISVAAIRTTKALRAHFLERTLRQDIAFFDAEGSGSVAVQVTTNGNHVNNGISEKLGLTIQGVSTFITAFIVAFAVQWKLTLITLCIVPAIIIVTSICVGIDVKNEASIMSIYAKAGQLAEDVIGSVTTVHAFWAHPKLADKYNKYLLNAKEVGMKKCPNYAVLFSGEFFFVMSGYALAFWQGIRFLASGEIQQPGVIVTVIFAVVLAATSMTQVAPQILVVTKAASAANELFRIIDREPKVDALSETGQILPNCQGDIEIKNLRFAYPSRPDVPVLHDFSISVPANKTTALVGASGSGKSTIVGLLQRWYLASGSITLDGIEISDLNVQWLRKQMRMVQQEPVLFQGTIFENVCHGLAGTDMVDAPEEQKLVLVQNACKASYAHDFIEDLPNGYQTVIGRGQLSGGQKQRIAIARSIISNPRILLLDEATSALDPKAEKIVQEALDELSHDRTTIVIAHRLSTIRRADNIIVMSAGAVVEQGTHEQLLALGGAYKRLVLAQGLDETSGEKSEGTIGAIENEDLRLTETKASRAATISQTEEEETLGYGLLKCSWILMKEQRTLWPTFFVVLAACILGGITYPGQALIFARVFEAMQIQDRTEMVSRADFLALMFFVIAIGNFFVYAALGWFTNVVSQSLTTDYRLQMFKDVLRQDLNFFHLPSNETGALVSRLSTKPTQLQELFGFNLALILINIVNLLSSCILAIAYGWKLGLVVVFGGLPALVGSGYVRIRLSFKADEDTEKLFSSSAALASEAVAAIRTVSSNTMERTVMKDYNERLAGVEKRSIKGLLWTNLFFALTQSVNFLAMALGFWYGGTLMSYGEYNTQQFFVVFISVIFSGEAAAAFFSYTTSITKGATAANYLLYLRHLQPSIAEQDDHSSPPSEKDDANDTTAEVQVDDVYFSYQSRLNAKVLRGVSTTIEPGKNVAFVGASGCGKTTLLSMIERFYDPTSGRITFNGKDLTSFCPRTYRRQLALVQQEPALYDGSVSENISLGLETPATDEQVQEACRMANIWEFVASLPEGLNTSCGARGGQLSGGQRQRIAIARALIRKPKLLLLDEATSALDTESEKIVQAAIDKASEKRTTIAVAHRLSTIKDCDEILVFDKGRIIERGRHSDLIRHRGVYWQMCLGQGLDQP